MTENQIRISVRNLVEFVLRSGSIDNRLSARVQLDAMMVGSTLHRKIQKSMGAGYQAEVALKHTVTIGELQLTLEGRADGILTEDGRVTIDEIKVVSLDFRKLEEPFPVHLAQAVCYGYIYALQKELSQVTIQITYCHPDSEEILRFPREYSRERLEEEFYGYLREYSKWAQFGCEHRRERNRSIAGLQFPFPYREGQRKLVVASYRAIMNGEILLIQAPTGIGKTLSVIFPAVVSLGQGAADKIFYLTAKTTTRSAAMEGLKILRERGAALSSVTIVAKEKLCFQEKMECNPLVCPYADRHFDRVNAAVYDLICHETEIDRDCLLRYARQYLVCPFEMCLDATYWVDVIICDYNYLFDPRVRLQRFFSENEQGDYIFLVDEAHNLVDRAREMYSAELYKEEFLEAKKLYKELPAVVKKLESCNRKLLELKRECDTWKVLPDGNGLGPFLLSLEALYSELTELPEKYPHWVNTREAGEFFFHVRDFLSVYDSLDENYRVYMEHTGDGKFCLHELCVNPARRISQCLGQGTAAVLFSATFLPIHYYKELLCDSEEVSAIYVKSPFDGRRRLIGIGADVTTRYTRRNQKEYARYAAYIRVALSARKGNYLVFFPSYRYMQETLKELELPDGYRMLVQDTGMREKDKEEFLSAFDGGQPTVGFCVMGGIFSEGIDLQGDALIGVIVAGTGLSQVNPRQEILQRFYEEQGRDGFAFAYLYPGMNKVQQAAGRLIRTFEDYGVILLLDERFLRREYQELFPLEWDGGRIMNSRNAEEILKEFWDRISADV